jgi:autotransporter-associated beta strand protein
MLAAAVGASVGIGIAATAPAAQHIYTPAGTADQWSAGTNWSATPVSAADTQLTLVGSNATVIPDGQISTTNNDLAGNFLLNILDLQGTGPTATDAGINVTGNTLEFVASGAALPVINLNAVDGAQDLDYAVSNALALTANTTFTGNGTSAFSFSGAIGGTGSLTKSGASAVVLSGTNTYAGGTTINGGQLRATQVAALPGYNAAGQVIVNSGGTLSLAAGGAGEWSDVDVDTLRSNATFNAGSVLGLNVDTANTFAYASNIANPIGLTKSGGGTLALSGTNTYTGTTTVAGGTLQSAAAANLPGYNTAGRVVVGGILHLLAGGAGWNSTEVNDLAGNATFNAGSTLRVEVAGADNIAVAANLTQPLALVKTGTGMLTLSGANTYTGATSLQDGTLAVNDGTQLGSGNLTLGNAAFPATLQVNGASATINSPIVLLDGNAAAPITLNAAGAVNFTGILKATEANAVLNVNSAGLTTFSGEVHTSDNASARNLRIGGSGNVLISAPVSNGTGGATAGTITYQGTGKLTLSGTNTHSGTTSAATGTLSITNASQLGTSRLELGSGTAASTFEVTSASPVTFSNNVVVRGGTAMPATLVAAAPLDFGGSLSATTGTALLLVNNTALTTFSGPVRLSDGTSNRTLRIGGSGNVLISGPVSNSPSTGVGSLYYTGTGTLTLSGTNTYTGLTTLNTGTLAISSGSQFGGNGRIDLGSNGAGAAATTFKVNGSSPVTITNQTYIRGSTGTPVTLQAATPVTFSGAFSAATGTGIININNTALTTLAGSVQLSEGASNRTLRIGGSGNVLISGPVSNSPSTGVGSLAYDGTGSLTINGTTSYTGTTAATSGKIVLGNSLTTSSSVTASGSGTIELASNGSAARVINTPSVSVSGTGKVDLKDNKLVTNTTAGSLTGTTYNGVQGFVQSGLNSGTWDGSGIVTSQGDALSGLTTIAVATGEQIRGLGTATDLWAGQTITGASTLAMYTYAGDLNLDGLINGDDYANIDFNSSNPSASGYFNGDINYDGVINGDDYASIDFNVNAQGAPFPTSGSVDGSLAVTAVPEPTSLSVIGLAAASLMTRRRRRPQ